MALNKYLEDETHSEDLREIIGKPPSWLLKRGITTVLLIIFMIFGLSALIKYPEVLSNSMVITTSNAPKVIINKTPGNLTEIKIREGDEVEAGDALAYLESTANHDQVLQLLQTFKEIRYGPELDTKKLKKLTSPRNVHLGELQSDYQKFYQAYLTYLSVKEGGVSLKRRKILEQEIFNIQQQGVQATKAYELQTKEIELAKQEFERYKALAEQKVISPMEFQAKEALLLSKLQLLPYSENNILNIKGSYLSRSKELAELDNQIEEERMKFFQAINSFVSEIENWKQKYVLSTQSKGKVIFASNLQVNQYVLQNEVVFYVHSEDSQYFGEMHLPQRDLGKIKEGQNVLIKVRSYPFEEYGYLNGKIKRISAIPLRDSFFLSRVEIKRTPSDSLIRLRPGTLADADVVTDDQTILFRIWKNIIRGIQTN